MSGENSISFNSSTKQKNASRVLVRLIIGHTSEKLSTPTLERHTHRWTVYVKAPGSIQLTDRSFIKKVTFMLHESFKDPIRVVKDPPFEVTETGYGSFIMPIKVQFNGIEKPFTINYDLNLSLIDKFCESNIEQKLELKYPSPELCALVQKYCPTKKDKEIKEKVSFSKNQFLAHDKNFSKSTKLNLLKEIIEKKTIQAPQKNNKKISTYELPVTNSSKHSKLSKSLDLNNTLSSNDLSSLNKSSEKSDTSSTKLLSVSSKNSSNTSNNKLNKIKTKNIATTKPKKSDNFADIFGSSETKSNNKSFEKNFFEVKKIEKVDEKDQIINKEKLKKKLKLEKNNNDTEKFLKNSSESSSNRQSNNYKDEIIKSEISDTENITKKLKSKNLANEISIKELEKKREKEDLDEENKKFQKKKLKEKKAKKKKQSVSPEKINENKKLLLPELIVKSDYNKLFTPNNLNDDFDETRPQSDISLAPLLTPISGFNQSPVFSTNFVESISQQSAQSNFTLQQNDDLIDLKKFEDNSKFVASLSEISDENDKMHNTESTSINNDEFLDFDDEEDYKIFKTSQEKYRRFSNLQLAVNNISKPELLTKVLDLLMEQDQNSVLTKNNFKTVNFKLINLKRETFLALENLVFNFEPSVNWWENLLIDHNKRKNTLRNK